jgi:hypothetical protein
VDVAGGMFTDGTWGMGCLGSSGDKFTTDLQTKILPLWEK